jgi:DNA-binding MarR family transcriptional regulator
MSDIDIRFRKAYWAAVHYVDSRRMRAWEERGLTLPQLRILFQLRAQPGITTNVLARRLGLTVPTVSGLVDKLARAGLVERGTRRDDRRVIPLTLSEDGTATVGEIREGNRAHLATLSEQLGPDLESVAAALELLADHINKLALLAQEGEENEPQFNTVDAASSRGSGEALAHGAT